MRYLLLICSDDKAAPPAPRAEMEALVQGHRRFSDELQAAGKMVAGERLRPDGDASRSWNVSLGSNAVSPMTSTLTDFETSPAAKLNAVTGTASGPNP